MEHGSKNELKYSPFVVTQVLEKQSCFLLQDGFIGGNHPQFDYILYKYLDQELFDSSFFRIFRIKEKVALVYYWKSKMREPRSNREGIYLIIGILCDYPVFRKEPLCIYNALDCFLKIIMNRYQSNDSTEIIDMIWKAHVPNDVQEELLFLHSAEQSNITKQFPNNTSDSKRSYQRQRKCIHIALLAFENIRDSFQSEFIRYIRNKRIPKYRKKIRFGACRLYLCIPSDSSEDIPMYFVSEAANWICHHWGKMDIASIKGHGDCFINVRLNTQGVPPNMKRVKLLERFNKTYLEIE